MLFKPFNNKNTTTENKRQRSKKPKGGRKLEIIYQCDIVCNILKWKTIKNNIQTKKGDKELKLKWLRTGKHVGYSGHRPVRKITIERCCTIKRCSNHSITRIQQQKKKDTKNTNTKKEEENWK